ncbi:MAG: hemin-degrading factor [Rhodoferax sp.]|nr:hemin-degrading factor [Rhodoferax sp.]
MYSTARTIRETFTSLRRSSKARHRDIAAQLGLSEGALIAAHVGVNPDASDVILHARRLRPEWPDIMATLEALGEVMALTRNASCVHEKTGVYRHVSQQPQPHLHPQQQPQQQPQTGRVQGGEIDLRIFYPHWAHGFAVVEQTGQGLQQSLQFFGSQGTAIHKVFLQQHSNSQAFTRLVDRFADRSQSESWYPPAPVAPASAPLPRAPERPDTAIDVAGFRRAWQCLRDTEDFSGLLSRFALTYTQALRLADARFAEQLATDDCQSLLQAAATNGVPIRVLVGNPGMVQTHAGTIHKVATAGPWLNVLDAGFNLHLRVDHIASAWVVKKPTVDGLVTSLELFDEQGDTIARFFGRRKPGQAEPCQWRILIENLQPEPLPCGA